jgi:hypothetical protein
MGYVASMGVKEKYVQGFSAETWKKKSFGGTMSRREDTQRYLECRGWERMEWFYLLQVRDKGCA